MTKTKNTEKEKNCVLLEVLLHMQQLLDNKNFKEVSKSVIYTLLVSVIPVQ